MQTTILVPHMIKTSGKHCIMACPSFGRRKNNRNKPADFCLLFNVFVEDGLRCPACINHERHALDAAAVIVESAVHSVADQIRESQGQWCDPEGTARELLINWQRVAVKLVAYGKEEKT